MEEEVQDAGKGISTSSKSWIIIAIILIRIGWFYYGWRKGRR
jgi:hypothetical protein